jgi:hypothetical protein
VRDAREDHAGGALALGEAVGLVHDDVAAHQPRLARTTTSHRTREVEVHPGADGGLEDGLSRRHVDPASRDGEAVTGVRGGGVHGSHRGEALEANLVVRQAARGEVGGDRRHHRIRTAHVGARRGPVGGRQDRLEMAARDAPHVAGDEVARRLEHVADHDPRVGTRESSELVAEDDVVVRAVRVDEGDANVLRAGEHRPEDADERGDAAAAADEQEVLRGVVGRPGEVARRPTHAEDGPGADVIVQPPRPCAPGQPLDRDHQRRRVGGRRRERIGPADLPCPGAQDQRQKLPCQVAHAGGALEDDADRVRRFAADLEHLQAALARESVRLGGDVPPRHLAHRARHAANERRRIPGEGGRRPTRADELRDAGRQPLEHRREDVALVAGVVRRRRHEPLF